MTRRARTDHPPARVEVIVASDTAAVEALRETWGAAPIALIDSDIDFFLTVVRNAPGVVRPHVILVRRPGRPDLMGIARIEDLPLPLTIGYRTLARPTLRAVVLTFGGMVGVESDEDEALLLNQLRGPLAAGDADALVLRKVDVSSSRHAIASSMAKGWLRMHGQSRSRRWTATVPGTLDEFLGHRSAKTRQTLRRQCRKLERERGDTLRLRRFDGPDGFHELTRDLETVAAVTYQRRLGAGHLGDELDHALIETGLRRGWFRAWVLYLDDVPVAFWSGTTHAGTFATGTPGFDPAYTGESVGRYTMLRMIEDLCADPAVDRLDFGHGDADYKEAFGTATALEADVLVLAGRSRPVMVGLLVGALTVLNGWGRRFTRGSSWGRRLKRAWRRRLAAPVASAAPVTTARR